jgi:hypothetical protein
MNEKEKLAFIITKSEHLKEIYLFIVNKKKFLQKDIKKNTNIKEYSHISLAVKKLKELGLIVCENPKDSNYKIYKVLDKTYEIKENIDEILK